MMWNTQVAKHKQFIRVHGVSHQGCNLGFCRMLICHFQCFARASGDVTKPQFYGRAPVFLHNRYPGHRLGVTGRR
ncbi:hypothetical protein DPEC_G00073050 [Dallia pectoralis]|uniref:Uncharacterized protein n=1 Tax=Dallia pectoralis TaxID=75939 RepID=A0ACC2H3K4_DALPE|nr:hypothetical protein DPEC_G00073050 [Dallia pectoralis]